MTNQNFEQTASFVTEPAPADPACNQLKVANCGPSIETGAVPNRQIAAAPAAPLSNQSQNPIVIRDLPDELELAPDRGDGPVIKGTRVEASQVWWRHRRLDQSEQEIVDSFNDVTVEQVHAAIKFVDGAPEFQMAGLTEEDEDA